MKTFRGKLQCSTEQLTAVDAIDDALYIFADALEVSC